ncbi:enoyl-CoA hydratase-related protein [Spirillospora sp. CA-255316]
MADVRYEVTDHVALITLDRPEALNAFTDTMEAELVECFERSDADDDVRVVILTGAGPAFCAGMDLTPADDAAAAASPFAAWRASPNAPAGTQYDLAGEELPVRRDGGGRVTLRIFDSKKPVIAAINGHAVGVGITMTLPCDLRVMAAEAKFAFPFTRRGFVTESCSSWFLPRLVPLQRALRWVLTGATLPASEALAAGLVLSLHPAEEVLDVALDIARDIAANAAPISASLSRRLLWRMLSADHPMTAHQLETAALNVCGVSSDADEGVTAFLEKRPPAFTGRVGSTPDFLRDLPHPSYAPPDSLG